MSAAVTEAGETLSRRESSFCIAKPPSLPQCSSRKRMNGCPQSRTPYLSSSASVAALCARCSIRNCQAGAESTASPCSMQQFSIVASDS